MANFAPGEIIAADAINEGQNAIGSYQNTQMLKMVLEIFKNNGNDIDRKGTGFLCQVRPQSSRCHHTYMITANHVLELQNEQELGYYYIKFGDGNEEKPKQLSWDFTDFVWLDPFLDIAVLALSKTYKSQWNDFDRIPGRYSEKPNETWDDYSAEVLQFPNEQAFSYSRGTIQKLIGNFLYMHNAGTDYGSSGSPLIMAKGVIVGVHHSALENTSSLEDEKPKWGLAPNDPIVRPPLDVPTFLQSPDNVKYATTMQIVAEGLDKVLAFWERDGKQKCIISVKNRHSPEIIATKCSLTNIGTYEILQNGIINLSPSSAIFINPLITR